MIYLSCWILYICSGNFYFGGFYLKSKDKKNKKSYKVKEPEYFTYNNEIFGIIILAFGILISLGLYLNDSVGVFGRIVRNVFLGLLGSPAFFIPPFIIVLGVMVLLKKNIKYFKVKLTYSLLLILNISGVFQAALYKKSDYDNRDFIKTIKFLYTQGNAYEGGGVLGGMISVPFLSFFSVAGTLIILTSVAIVLCILLTNISFVSVLVFFKNIFVNIGNKIKAMFTKKENDIADNNSKLVDIKEVKNKKAKSLENIAEAAPALETATVQKQPEVKAADNDSKIEFIINDAKKIADFKQISVDDIVSPGQELRNTNYTFPSLDLLSLNSAGSNTADLLRHTAVDGAKKLEETLKSFGVDAKVINVSIGPAVTRYELQPSMGVKVSKIVNLADDIALNLASAGVRIEAPIPGKAAVGIEVPNKEMTPVLLREVLESNNFIRHASNISFGLGMDISGQPVIADIAKMPHVLIAGATGSGKSVCINSIIISLLYKSSPDDVKLLMIDPKVVELGIYNGIPHLLIPVVTEPKKAAGALNWAVTEMVNRYKLFAEKGVRDLPGYNAVMLEEGEETKLPQIVIIIDELADLMMVAPRDVEDAICRLAQMARAAGMHLVIATQRPSVDVITGIIKANIPSRISFAVSSQVDSRTILDMAGAEKLLGKGDMLFYPVGEPKPIRIKGTFISDKEVEKVVDFIKDQHTVKYNEDIIEEINTEKDEEEPDPGDNDELLSQVIEMVVEAGQASTSLIQRKFKVGYARAGRIMDQMEARGIVGPFEGSKPRQVLISRQQLMEMQMQKQ